MTWEKEKEKKKIIIKILKIYDLGKDRHFLWRREEKEGRRDGVSVFCADEVEPKWI